MPKRRGEIIAVKDLFAKYRSILKAPQKSVEMAAVRVIESVSSVRLKEGQISYTVASRTLFVRAPSLIKQELQFHHQTILVELKNDLGEKNCPKNIL